MGRLGLAPAWSGPVLWVDCKQNASLAITGPLGLRLSCEDGQFVCWHPPCSQPGRRLRGRASLGTGGLATLLPVCGLSRRPTSSRPDTAGFPGVRGSCLRGGVAAAWHSCLRDTTRCCAGHSLAVWFSVALCARTVAFM